MKKGFGVILIVLLVIGFFIGVGVGIATLTCLIFMLIFSSITGAPITFDAYFQLLGQNFWWFLLIGIFVVGGIAAIVNYFRDLSADFARAREAKRVYKDVKKQNLDPMNMTEYQKKQYKIHKQHRIGKYILGGMCFVIIIIFVILFLLTRTPT